MKYIKNLKQYGPIIISLFLIVSFISSCSHKKKHFFPVTLRLKWLYNASFAGPLWAQARGLFYDRGLKVTIKEGGIQQNAIQDLLLGRAQFAVASADQVIRAASQGAKLVVLAQIFQKNPLQWIYFSDKEKIETPKDLIGKTIGITYGGNDEFIMDALLKKYHISKKQVNLYAITYDMMPFWKGKVDMWPVYRNTQGIVLAQKIEKGGHKAGFFNPDKFGIKFVANSLITSQKFFNAHPDIVKKFTQAVLRGWSEALYFQNIEEAAQIVHDYDKQTPTNIILKQLQATQSLVIPPGHHELGWINKKAWQQTEEILLKEGIISHPIDVEKLFAPKNF